MLSRAFEIIVIMYCTIGHLYRFTEVILTALGFFLQDSYIKLLFWRNILAKSLGPHFTFSIDNTPLLPILKYNYVTILWIYLSVLFKQLGLEF